MSKANAISLSSKLEQITEHWTPSIVAAVNDSEIKLAKLHGEFVWHSHADSDELFYVVAGTLVINFREDSVTLRTGDMYVVPKGVEHQPVAEEEVHVMLIEHAGTVNTGDAGGPLTCTPKEL